jgi:hypothetical protein
MTLTLEAARRFSLVLFVTAIAAGCGGGSSPDPTPPSGCTSGSSTTQLQVTNATSTTVPVMITLGTTRNPASNYGINNIGQLPAAWSTYPYSDGVPTDPIIQSIFLLAGGDSVCFNSGALSFAGNVAFGPNFAERGCGGADTTVCFPDASTAFEFALNLGPSGQETVDISGVNGTNALGFWNLDATPVWTNTLTPASVTQIRNAPIASWTAPADGVYGWQSTDCIQLVPPIPNPVAGCPAPLHWPSQVTQNQASRVCNVSRASGATGGTAQIVFNGYASGSAPGVACVGGFARFKPHHASAGTGGVTLTMNGYGLDAVTGVQFQGVAATIVGTPTANQIVVTTPVVPYCAPGATELEAVVTFTVNGVAGVVTPAPPGVNYTFSCP